MRKTIRNVLGVLALLILVLSAVFSLPAEGAVWYVTVEGSGAKDGSSWEDSYGEGQFPNAISSSDIGDELWVAMGSYKPSSDDIDVSFQMKSGVALYGGFSGTETSRDQRDWTTNETILTGALGDNLHSKTVVMGSGTDGTAVLDGFTITGGKGGVSAGYGGGMYNAIGSPTVTNCTFSGNEAGDYGGAMYNDDNSSPAVTDCTFSDNEVGDYGGAMYNNDNSSPTVTDCTFSGNEAGDRGGAMYNDDNSSPAVKNCTFSGNEAGARGGAMYNDDNSSPAVTDCTFSGNEATYYDGGAMYNRDSSPAVTNCTFSGNEARDGGAIYSNSSPTVTNCTFSGNVADEDGGAMNNRRDRSPTVKNCTFSGNVAGDSGGAMYNATGSSPIVVNSILWGNSGGEIVNSGSSASPEVTYCVISGGYGGGGDIISDDPCLDPLGEYGGTTKTFALGGDSPAVNRGTNTHVSFDIPSADQRGFPRDVSYDIGSYEHRDDLKILSVTITGLGTVGRDPSGDILTSSNQWIYSRDLPVTLTAVPTSPYYFNGWGGALSGKELSPSLTMDEDRFVTANFGDTWTILASAEKGGTITPEGEMEVRNGADKTFTISADQGYNILEVTVDGEPVGAPSSYTFNNVSSDHTIEASFAEGTYDYDEHGGNGGCQIAGIPFSSLFLLLPLALLKRRNR